MTETPNDISSRILNLEVERAEVIQEIKKGKLDQVYQDACIEQATKMFHEKIYNVLAGK